MWFMDKILATPGGRYAASSMKIPLVRQSFIVCMTTTLIVLSVFGILWVIDLDQFWGLRVDLPKCPLFINMADYGSLEEVEVNQDGTTDLINLDRGRGGKRKINVSIIKADDGLPVIGSVPFFL